jgi:hypothetical protein
MTTPNDFVTSFLKQPYPTMGLAPSVAVIHGGGTVNQAGQGGDGLGATGQTLWARIASAVPFGWTLGGIQKASKAVGGGADAVIQKINEGPAAVDGLVKSASDGIKNVIGYSKWIVVGLVAVAFIVFAAQVKTLVKS